MMVSQAKCLYLWRACIAPTHPAKQSARSIVSSRQKTALFFTQRTSALDVVTASMRVLLAPLSTHKQAISEPVAKWTNAPSARVAPRILNMNMARTACLRVSYRYARKCAPPRLYSPETVTKSLTFIESGLSQGDLALEPGVGALHMTQKIPRPCATVGPSLWFLFWFSLERAETRNRIALSNMRKAFIPVTRCLSSTKIQEKTLDTALVTRGFEHRVGVLKKANYPWHSNRRESKPKVDDRK